MFSAPHGNIPLEAGPERMIIEEEPPAPPKKSQKLNIKDFDAFRPNHHEFFKYDNVNFAPAIKSINTTLETGNYPLVTKNDVVGVYSRFLTNPQEHLKQFTAEERFYLINWICETLIYIGISDKTIGFIDLLRMLSVDSGCLEMILKNEDKIYQILRFLERPEQALLDLPKGLKTVLFRFLTNLTATDKSKLFFGNNIVYFIDLLIRVGNIFKEDKGIFSCIVMTLWNSVQNLTDTSNWAQVTSKITEFSLSIFNSEEDNQVLLGSLTNLCWMGYHEEESRNQIKNNIDNAKLAKTEFSQDITVGKFSRDLLKILQV